MCLVEVELDENLKFPTWTLQGILGPWSLFTAVLCNAVSKGPPASRQGTQLTKRITGNCTIINAFNNMRGCFPALCKETPKP